MSKNTDPNDQSYRNWLVSAEQKAQESFDKMVVALSGGALGTSFVFLREVISGTQIEVSHLLLWAWGMWAGSLLAVLLSHHMSQRALRYAIAQVDDDTIYNGTPGGRYARWTEFLNFLGAALLIVGIFIMGWFVKANMSQSMMQSGGVGNVDECVVDASTSEQFSGGEGIQAAGSAAPEAYAEAKSREQIEVEHE
jgi:hypothetical protein